MDMQILSMTFVSTLVNEGVYLVVRVCILMLVNEGAYLVVPLCILMLVNILLSRQGKKEKEPKRFNSV